MKAVQYRRHGSPDVLEYVDVVDPEPGTGEVLIAVRAAALNRLDLLQREGPPVVPGFTLPHIAGMDIAGEIVETGPDVHSLTVGTRVLVNPSLFCGWCEFCRRGDNAMCPNGSVIGASRSGGYAELVVAPETHVYPVPDRVSDVHAATIPTAFSTAWHALMSTGALQPGEVLVVHAAGSGVSVAAIQLAKRCGATVIATSRSDDKLALASHLGADLVVNSRSDDVVARVRHATDGRGADMVFDHVGPALFTESLFSLRPRGRLVFAGTTTGTEAMFNLAYAYHFGLRILGSDPYQYAEFERMLEFYWRSDVDAVVAAELPLARAADAQRLLASEHVAGKVVLLPEG
jgi:NADPH:quinone reductase-like Zn-dependent oxidoreductase